MTGFVAASARVGDMWCTLLQSERERETIYVYTRSCLHVQLSVYGIYALIWHSRGISVTYREAAIPSPSWVRRAVCPTYFVFMKKTRGSTASHCFVLQFWPMQARCRSLCFSRNYISWTIIFTICFSCHRAYSTVHFIPFFFLLINAKFYNYFSSIYCKSCISFKSRIM